jgi:hypothetical protein
MLELKEELAGTATPASFFVLSSKLLAQTQERAQSMRPRKQR